MYHDELECLMCRLRFICRSLSQAVLAGINSKAFQEDVSSSLLSELKGLVWALTNTKGLNKTRPMVLSIVSKIGFKRLLGKHIECKEMKANA